MSARGRQLNLDHLESLVAAAVGLSIGLDGRGPGICMGSRPPTGGFRRPLAPQFLMERRLNPAAATGAFTIRRNEDRQNQPYN